MSNQANPAAIGAFIIGAIVLFVLGVIIIGGGKWFSETKRFVVYFEESINGLVVGAPVKLNGVQVGQVVDIKVVRDLRLKKMLAPVVFEIVPEKIVNYDSIEKDMESEVALEAMIKDGLRLQLQMTSMLTGRLFIEVRFLPDSPVNLLHRKGDLPEVPSVPSSVQAIENTVNKLLSDFQKIPLEELFIEIVGTARAINKMANSQETLDTLDAFSKSVIDLQQIVAKLNLHSDELIAELQQTLHRTNRVMKTLNVHAGPLLKDSRETVTSANAALQQMQSTFETVETVSQQVNPVAENLNSSLSELSKAARAIRVLADYLERHPEALIQGKSLETGEQ